MNRLIGIASAAEMLDVSKQTLRNWDRSGQLTALRNPNNNYREYRLSDIEELMQRNEAPPPPFDPATTRNASTFRRVLAKVHNIIRDNDGNSSILERFDECIKLLFLFLSGQKTPLANSSLSRKCKEKDSDYGIRLRGEYAERGRFYSGYLPKQFAEIKLSPKTIALVGDTLSGTNFAHLPLDAKGLAYEDMIRNTFDKGENQQFFTPSVVVDFLTELVRPYCRGIVCDPACGTGGFLVSVFRRGLHARKLVGFEIDQRLAWVTDMNLNAHGITDYEILLLENGGTLGFSAERYFNSLDLIITNPPFGSDFSEPIQLSKFALGRGKLSRRRGVLFIERCLQLLKNHGHVGIVIDDGVLSSPSTTDVREYVISHSEILAIISLPESAFLPYANVNTSILLLRKSSNPDLKRPTFFAKAKHVGRRTNGEPDTIFDAAGKESLKSDLPEILLEWRAFVETGTLHNATKNVFVGKIAKNFKLGQASVNRLDFQYHHPSRHQARQKLRKSKNTICNLSDLCDEVKEIAIPSKQMTDQYIRYTGLANIEAETGIARQIEVFANTLKSSVKKYGPFDILFSRMRPNLRKVALADFSEGGHCSPECSVLRVKYIGNTPKMDPLILSIVLRSDLVFGQLLHLITGIGRPRLSSKDLMSVQIPLPSQEQQYRIRSTYEAEKQSYEILSREAASLLRNASQRRREAVNFVAEALVS